MNEDFILVRINFEKRVIFGRFIRLYSKFCAKQLFCIFFRIVYFIYFERDGRDWSKERNFLYFLLMDWEE